MMTKVGRPMVWEWGFLPVAQQPVVVGSAPLVQIKALGALGKADHHLFMPNCRRTHRLDKNEVVVFSKPDGRVMCQHTWNAHNFFDIWSRKAPHTSKNSSGRVESNSNIGPWQKTGFAHYFCRKKCKNDRKRRHSSTLKVDRAKSFHPKYHSGPLKVALDSGEIITKSHHMGKNASFWARFAFFVRRANVTFCTFQKKYTLFDYQSLSAWNFVNFLCRQAPYASK